MFYFSFRDSKQIIEESFFGLLTKEHLSGVDSADSGLGILVAFCSAFDRT